MRAIISGGGTGGHIYPAIAIGEAIQRAIPAAVLLFVGAKGKMEMKKVPEAGYKIIGLWISGLQRKFTLENLLFPLKLMVSLIKSFFIIKSFHPDAVIGVGGYASGPLLQVATLLRLPTIIQEQNALPGITNKLLASRVDRICVVFEGMEKYFPAEKIVITGIPVRANIMAPPPPSEQARAFFGLPEKGIVVLVTGGSLGAKAINACIATHIHFFEAQDVYLLWQCGDIYYASYVPVVKGKEHRIKLMPFIKDMSMAYAAADIIISRAGGTIAELAIAAKPCILMPSPNVAEDHQAYNANALVTQDAAIMVRDKEADDKLFATLLDLIHDRDRRTNLGINIKKMAIKNAADRIASEVITLVKTKKAKA